MYKELIESSGETDENMVLGTMTKSTKDIDSCNSQKG